MQTPLPDPQHPGPPAAPPIPLPEAAVPVAGDPANNTMGGMVPTGNPHALWAYYVGLFSAMPLFGLGMGPFAVHKGLKGLRLSRENPAAKGTTHAWVGIICGGFWSVFHWVLFIGLIVTILGSRK